MSDDDLCYLSASEALGLFRKRSLKPSELLAALHKRAAKVNPAINCFADQYWDEAMEKAKAADAAYAKRGGRVRPLEGVPLAVKDAQRVKGKRTTHGSLIFMDAPPDAHSDPMIERLEKAGAIIFARTTTPEFCLTGVTHSRAWGITRNPWAPDWGPGGSSGGSGAALAAGLTTLATGTDIGGSIRIPAGCCGVVGFKPPHGRNPDGPPANFDRFNHCGPMTRSLADAALMQSLTAGPHPLDHDSLRGTAKLPTKAASIKGMKIAYSLDFGYVNLDADVRRNTLLAIDHFRDLGATVEEADLGWSAETDSDCLHWYNMMHFGRQTAWHAKTHAHLMSDYAVRMAEAVNRNSTLDDVHRPWQRSHINYQTLGPVLAKYDVLICPTNNVPSVKADHDPWDMNFTVNGRKADPEYGWVMTHPFNMLHNCPVLSLPSGFAATGVPTGIQIVGRTWDDARVFKVGLAYEKAVGGWYGDRKKRPKF
ncbi:amidase [Aestuariivirga sp.]|uniref:amidase n=1 Tax=Aestuariivirga sp. TaxID=2650926 RepID=UPI0039E6915D